MTFEPSLNDMCKPHGHIGKKWPRNIMVVEIESAKVEGRNMLGMQEEQHGNQCGWSTRSKGENNKR